MKESASSTLISALKAFAHAASVMVTFAGCLVLACCIFDLSILGAGVKQLVANSNAALGFILAGLALGLLSAKFKPQAAPNPKLIAIQRRIGVACACAVSLIGLVTLVNYVFGWNLAIDGLLFEQRAQMGGAMPSGRMAPNIALNFLLIGCALLFLSVRVKPAQVLTLIAGCVALLTFLPGLYGHKDTSGIATQSRLAMATAVTFVVLCAGLLCARIDGGLTAIVAKPSAGGVIARRLLPTAFIVPILLGWLVVEGWRRSYFDTEMGLALFTILNVVMFTTLFAWTARTSDRIDTERESAKEALWRTEKKYRSIVENAIEGIFQATMEGRFLTVNPALARILAYDSPEDLMQGVVDFRQHLFVDPKRRDEFLRLLQERGVVTGFEFEARRQDGQRVWLTENARLVHPHNGDSHGMYEGTVMDITQRRRLEEQLRQAQKTEAIGRLAGGIAHDFNNILAVVLGYTEMGLTEFPATGPAGELLTEIQKAAQRAAKLTRQLLAFSRKQKLMPQVLDLNALVNEFEKMLRRLIGEDVNLAVTLDPWLGAVKADPGQIEQVIMNLVINARDAMPNGGMLGIKTENMMLDETYTRQHPGLAPGPYVMLSISDTGCGMDVEVQSHLFEPYFTTKGQGKGTGLGLAAVHGIVKQSGGHIHVYSEPGHGTVFKIYMPRVETCGLIAQWKETPDEIPGGRETILLVEDDSGVRAMTHSMLESLGYRVMDADDAEKAAEICQQSSDSIHLLLTDVMMPGKKGPDLAKELIAQGRVPRAIFMSGYTDEFIVPLGDLSHWPFLQKPFTRAALGREVRKVLEQPNRNGNAPRQSWQQSPQTVSTAGMAA